MRSLILFTLISGGAAATLKLTLPYSVRRTLRIEPR